MPKTKSFRSSFKLYLLFILSASAILCQYRAGLQGTVTDPNGSVVPEADLTLTSLETNLARSAKTNGSGTYSIPSLAPGRYRLSIEKTGFAKKQLDNVVVLAEQTQAINIQLDLGQVSQTVNVDAGAPTLNTETATIGGNITSSELQNLPSFGRDPFQLVRLAPGVFGDGAVSGTGG